MTPRQQAEQYRAERDLPAGGYVIIYRGEPQGWSATLDMRNGWVAGCIAVPPYRNSPLFIATGGDDHTGAAAWDRMDPRYEPDSSR